MAAARAHSPYVALPIFPTRCFRHHALFVRTDRGIRGPKDLEEKIVGLREYTNTVSLVARGVLQSYYGVDLGRIRWRVGDVDARERTSTEIKVPAIAGIDIALAGMHCSQINSRPVRSTVCSLTRRRFVLARRASGVCSRIGGTTRRATMPISVSFPSCTWSRCAGL